MNDVSRLMRMRAARNSFQELMKANKATVTRPGVAKGRKTLVRRFHDEHPSITAASSISRGIASKLLRMR